MTVDYLDELILLSLSTEQRVSIVKQLMQGHNASYWKRRLKANNGEFHG